MDSSPIASTPSSFVTKTDGLAHREEDSSVLTMFCA